MIQAVSRRAFLQTAGGGAVVVLAGCLGTARTDTPDTPQPSAEEHPSASEIDVDRIAADPTAVPPPVDWDQPREHTITLTTKELTAEIEPGVTFHYMTYDGQIPGPMLRVRVGDTINLTFEVPANQNHDVHNVDFHAVYGPGGGAVATTIAPGDEPARLRFKAAYPGVFTYHCAVPNMDQHVSAGMFGLILVEPEEGLPEVDREFYLGQHELYTSRGVGEEGYHGFSFETMYEEAPTYVVFNGEAYAFTEDGHGPLNAEVGETVRVYFVNGGPNLTSSVHPIGNVWSRLYRDGDLVSDPAQSVETTPVAPGTATVGEMELPVPGPIKIVDHALSRAVRRGTIAVIEVEGEENPEIYEAEEEGS